MLLISESLIRKCTFFGEVSNLARLGVEVEHNEEESRKKCAEEHGKVRSESHFEGGCHWKIADNLKETNENKRSHNTCTSSS